MSDESISIDAMEARLQKVEAIQRRNLPKFANVLKRLAAMEKSVATAVIAITSLEKLAKDGADLRASNAIKLDENTEKLDTILGVLTATRNIGGFMRKHGPRVIAFLVGGLVLSGRITPDFAKGFLHLFGL